MHLLLAALILAQDEREAALARMSALRTTVAFHETALEDAIDYFRELSGLTIVVDARIRERYPNTRVTLRLKDVSLKSALRLTLSPFDVGATFRDGALVILPKEELRRRVELRVYDVRDLLHKIRDFDGPKVELAPPGQGPSVVTSIPIEPEPRIGDDFLLELIRANTGGGSWESEGASVTVANGLLLVVQTKSVQGEVHRLLDGLRQIR